MPQRIPDHTEILVVGEGAGEAELVRQILDRRYGESHPWFVDDAGGNTKFSRYLSGLAARTGGARLRAIVIVADCDDGPEKSFKEVRKQIKTAALPCPNEPFRFARRRNQEDNPATYVLMLPFGPGPKSTKGALETLLLPAVRAKFPDLDVCLEPWRECAQKGRWSTTHRDKFLLRSLLAAAHPSDPNYGIQYALKPSSGLIPIDHECFHPLTELLESLPRELDRT
jgi:hypothetical protein